MSMWGITKVIDESDWFEGYVRLALSTLPPSLPARRQKLGATSIQWFEVEPGVAFIDARGGSPDDRVLASQYMRSMLAGHGFRVAQYEIDYSLEKTSKWGDIMAKAKRLIQTGKVQLLRNGAQNVVGSVIGDHGTYQTEFSREDPNSQSITQWQCECPWDQYAWQRTRQWKKYEGRPCAHVLATHWASQAHPIDEEAHPAQQAMPMQGQQPQNIPGPAFAPPGPAGSPFAQQPSPMQGVQPMLPGMAPPGQAMGTPPVPGLPPEVLPPFPMEGQLEPQPPQVSIPGAKPQSPLNPVQWPGGTLSSVQEWDWEKTADMENSNMVQIIGTDMGVAEGPDQTNPMHGQYLDIASNSRGIGEVLGQDNIPGMGPVVEVIFPLDKTAELQPYHIRAWLKPEQLKARPDIMRPGPMIKRRR
jgi:hypothetical protein